MRTARGSGRCAVRFPAFSFSIPGWAVTLSRGRLFHIPRDNSCGYSVRSYPLGMGARVFNTHSPLHPEHHTPHNSIHRVWLPSVVPLLHTPTTSTITFIIQSSSRNGADPWDMGVPKGYAATRLSLADTKGALEIFAARPQLSCEAVCVCGIVAAPHNASAIAMRRGFDPWGEKEDRE